MPVDAKARGIQVLTELYPDPAVRDARMAELGDVGLTALGNGVLRREDHSREMNELTGQRTALTAREQEAKDLYESNKAWFEQKQAELAELETLRAQVAAGGGGKKPDPDPAKPDPKYVTPEQIADLERGAVGFMDELTDLKFQHFHQFGEVLDGQKLLRHPKVQQVGIRGVYAEVFKPQLDARIEKLRLEAEEKIRLDERQKMAVERASQHHPYPVRGNEPSTLDGLEKRADQPLVGKTVDEMAAEYVRLGAARSI